MIRRSAAIAIGVGMLAIALVLPAAAGAAERIVSVSAKVTLKVPNDSASVGFAISKERRTRAAALRAASGKLRATIAAAQAIPGVGEGDVKTGRISVRKTSRGGKTVYRAGEGITVTLHEPKRAGELTAAGIKAGATGVRGPYYFVGDTEAAESRALAAAFDKAKARAATLAKQAGATLGPAIEIDEGDSEFIPVPDAASGAGKFEGSFEESGESFSPPTKPSTSKVTATVHVIFELR